MTDISKEHAALMKRAQDQPGVKEMLEVYGQYELLLRQSNEYLTNTTPRENIITSNSTSR